MHLLFLYRPQDWEVLRGKRKTTQKLWLQLYPGEEFWPLKRQKNSKDGSTSMDESRITSQTDFTYDILTACMRQKLFYYQVHCEAD